MKYFPKTKNFVNRFNCLVYDIEGFETELESDTIHSPQQKLIEGFYAQLEFIKKDSVKWGGNMPLLGNLLILDEELEEQCPSLDEINLYYVHWTHLFKMMTTHEKEWWDVRQDIDHWNGLGLSYKESVDMSRLITKLYNLSLSAYQMIEETREEYGIQRTPATNGKNKKYDFRTIVQYKDVDLFINRLHQLIDGKQGADVGCVLLQAKIKNYITRNPKKAEFISEFDLIGSWSAITNYLDDNDLNALNRANTIVFFETEE